MINLSLLLCCFSFFAIVGLLLLLELSLSRDRKQIDDFIRQNKKPTAKERIKQIEEKHKEEIAELNAKYKNHGKENEKNEKR